jgi:hypothetical protein
MVGNSGAYMAASSSSLFAHPDGRLEGGILDDRIDLILPVRYRPSLAPGPILMLPFHPSSSSPQPPWS